MVRIVSKIFSTVRNHPKKSIFFGAIATYGIIRTERKFSENSLITEYCLEALKYGNEKHMLNDKHRHITVILNPAADKGKSKQKFERFCAPLLHLAGIKVAIVRTEHEGQAKELMGIMEKTDGVVVAGGDGTLSEVITGLMRREDRSEAIAKLPISVLPLGNSGYSGKAIHGIKGEPKPTDMMDATMAIIKQTLKPVNVVEIVPVAEPSQSTVVNEVNTLDQSPKPTAKPVYIVGHFEWGAFRDAWDRRDKYWYWGALRGYVTYLFSSYKKDLTWSCSCRVDFTLPCSGCCKCRPSVQKSLVTPPVEEVQKTWYHYLIGQPAVKVVKNEEEKIEPEADYSAITNPECDMQYTTYVNNASEVKVTSLNYPPTSHLSSHSLLLQIAGPHTTGSYITEGWKRTQTNNFDCTYKAKHIVDKVTILPTKSGEEKEFSLDGEAYEVRPLTLRISPLTINAFVKPASA